MSILGIISLALLAITDSLVFSNVSCTANAAAEQETLGLSFLQTWRFLAAKFADCVNFFQEEGEDEARRLNKKWVFEEQLRNELVASTAIGLALELRIFSLVL